MNLFGCKFCEEIGDEIFCDRKNFDSLLWATVTVFQVSDGGGFGGSYWGYHISS